MKLEAKIESILFYKNEPVSIKKLSSLLETDTEKIKEALEKLEENLRERGITVIREGETVSLTTSKENSSLIEQITKDELSKEIGKSGLETLAIVLYNGPISRRDIDYIRGVNSTFILRNLSARGLVEKVSDTKNLRSYLYKPTLETLAHLGLTKIEDLPDYESFKTKTEQSVSERKETDE